MKVSIRKTDKQFSEIMRKVRPYCEKCHRTTGLCVAHYHGRRKESVRFDPENILILCFACHQYFHENPLEHSLFVVKKIGRKAFDRLTIRANTPQKRDDVMQNLVNAQLIKSLDKLNNKE